MASDSDIKRSIPTRTDVGLEITVGMDFARYIAYKMISGEFISERIHCENEELIRLFERCQMARCRAKSLEDLDCKIDHEIAHWRKESKKIKDHYEKGGNEDAN